MTIVTLSVKLISQVSFQLHHVATRKATFARVVLRDPRVTHDPPAFPKGNRISYFASISKFSSIYFSLCFSKVYYHRCTLFILHISFFPFKIAPSFQGLHKWLQTSCHSLLKRSAHTRSTILHHSLQFRTLKGCIMRPWCPCGRVGIWCQVTDR